MLTRIDVNSWAPVKVRDWLLGICEDSSWLNTEVIFEENIGGKKLLLMTPQDIEKLGATKVNLQEQISEAIECLRFYNFNMTEESLQAAVLRLSCQSKSLQRQLATKRSNNESKEKNIILSSEFKDSPVLKTKDICKKQRVSLDTLTTVSTIVTTVKHVTDFLNHPPFSNLDVYRSIKSLILALSIELTSTAQRDQFVERPNDIIEKSSAILADYCEKIVLSTRDPLLIQPFHLETVRIRKNLSESDLGLKIKSTTTNPIHLIERILPLSLAKKTNKLNEGDEILQFNQFIIGWSAKNVEKLLNTSSQMTDIILMVKKRPSE